MKRILYAGILALAIACGTGAFAYQHFLNLSLKIQVTGVSGSYAATTLTAAFNDSTRQETADELRLFPIRDGQHEKRFDITYRFLARDALTASRFKLSWPAATDLRPEMIKFKVWKTTAKTVNGPGMQPVVKDGSACVEIAPAIPAEIIPATRYKYTAMCAGIAFFASALLLAAVLFFTRHADLSRLSREHFDAAWLENSVRGLCARIPKLHAKTFLWLLALCGVLYGLHTTCYMFGNHSYSTLCQSGWDQGSLAMGRFSGGILNSLLTDGGYFPVLNDLLSFAGMSATAIALCYYWQVPERLWAYLLTGALYIISPFTLVWFYYNATSIFITPAMVILALILADIPPQASRKRRLLRHAGGITLLWLVLGNYPSALNTIGVVLLGRLTIEVLGKPLDVSGFKSLLRRYRGAITDIVAACLLYKVTLTALTVAKIMNPGIYTIRSTPITELPGKALGVGLLCLRKLVDYSSPFLPQSLTLLFTGALLLAVLTICLRHRLTGVRFRLSAVVPALVLLLLTALSTGTAALLASDSEATYWAPRIDYFGLHYFRILCCVLLLLYGSKIIQTAGVCLMFLIFRTSAIQDFSALGIWKVGTQAETMTVNRMLARLESNPNFDPAKKYVFLQIGEYRSQREKYYREPYSHESLGLLTHNSDPAWDPWTAHEFWYPQDFRKRSLVESHLSPLGHDRREQYLGLLRTVRPALEQARAWPAPSSLIVQGNLIVLIADQDELKKILPEL